MILITGGCSFSECISPWIDTWPRHVERATEPKQAFHEGLGCQGNGMISREIIWRTSQFLDKADDLLVGIMWSGPDRHETLLPKNKIPKNITHGMAIPGHTDKWFNPYNWINETSASWLIQHHSGDSDFSKEYYAKISNRWYSQILTIEHILRVQWFLKLHNIRYFMTTFTEQVLPKPICNDPNIKYLYDQIDFDQFLPVVGEYEWCRDYSGLEFPVKGDPHPGTEQHKLFVEQIILPFLKQKDYT